MQEEVKRRRFGWGELAKAIRLTPAGLRESMKNDTLRIHHLEVISKTIGVPMSFWFQDDGAGHAEVKQSNAHLKEIKRLNSMLDDCMDDKARLKQEIDRLRRQVEENPGRKRAAG